MTELQWIQKSPIGLLHLVASQKGLQGIYWKKQLIPVASSLSGKSLQHKTLHQTVDELGAYFTGKINHFTVTLDLQGTDFQKQVWAALQKIPYGSTQSYKQIASQIKNPNASRAVGTANGRNPVSIIIPCHRVIAADGTLGGYAGGLKIKTFLLDLEKRAKLK